MDLLSKIVALTKRRGFVFPSSEIYGGLSSLYDYGHYGVLLKNNIKNLWWQDNVLRRDDVVGIDSAVILQTTTWQASGHLAGFADPLVECKNCHQRYRFDHLKEGKYGQDFKKNKSYVCPSCQGELSTEKKFNLMFATHIGPVEEDAAKVYLRPETAQGIFINFKNILDSYSVKLPFGIAQIGKAFRNEITPGNFIFRMREFEQMEIEFFVKKGDDESWHKYWLNERLLWYQKYGIRKENLRLRQHGKDELSHYAKDTYDIEYHFPWGWGELEGIANRTDFDLKAHQKASQRDLTYFDEEEKQNIVPYVIEPSAGADRTTLAFLLDAYREDDKRIILAFHPQIAPIKVAVFPLVANKTELVKKARTIYDDLKKSFTSAWDSRGNIGKRYFAQDEIGTPWCVTVDYDTLTDKTVTVRDRNTAKQVRVKYNTLTEYFRKHLR